MSSNQQGFFFSLNKRLLRFTKKLRYRHVSEFWKRLQSCSLHSGDPLISCCVFKWYPQFEYFIKLDVIEREPFMAAAYWIFSSHSKSLLRFSWKVPSALLGRTRVPVSLYHIISILFTVQMYYTELVRNLLAQQTDRVLGQRLLDAFNQLTPSNMKLSLDRLNKMQFRKSLDLFLRSVKGFLCVK